MRICVDESTNFVFCMDQNASCYDAEAEISGGIFCSGGFMSEGVWVIW